MAAGVPVVASDVGGLRDVVDDASTGILVPYDDTEGLSDAILRILQNGVLAERMGAAGCKKVEERFSLSRYESSLLGVYQRYMQASG